MFVIISKPEREIKFAVKYFAGWIWREISPPQKGLPTQENATLNAEKAQTFLEQIAKETDPHLLK
jgi:hypothetical protein